MSDGSIQRRDEVKPWGKPNPRGANHEDKARAFVAAHPVGTTLSPGEFDRWAEGEGLITLPPDGADKKSDAWKAHLQRRHELRYNIIRAGTHPRMDTPFTIEHVAAERYEVRSPQLAVGKTKMFEKLESLMKTKRQQLAYLMQSADWSVLPPHEKAFAEALFDDIDSYGEMIELNNRSFDKKFGKLAFRLQRAVDSGEITPQNGGIRAIVDGRIGDDE